MIQIVTGIEDGKVAYRKATPKRMAQSILQGTIAGRVECIALDEELPEMTVREQELVYIQMLKISKRLYKALGY